MAFEVNWHPKAVKFLEKLPKDVAIRIREKIDETKENPRRYIEKLVGSKDYRIRSGDYRVFVEVIYNPDTLSILAIRHRKDAYKRD